MSLTASSAAALSMGSVAQGLSSLGQQVKELESMARCVDRSLELSLEGHGTATVSPQSDGKDYLVEVTLPSGSKFRVACVEQGICDGRRTTGKTGDVMYLPSIFVDLGEAAWSQGEAVLSIGVNTIDQQVRYPYMAPTFFVNRATGNIYGEARGSMLDYAGAAFNRQVQGELARNNEDFKTLATLVKEVLPAITALNTALRNSLNS